LKAASGLNNKRISQELGLCEDTIGLWRKRWIEESRYLEKLAKKPEQLRKAVEDEQEFRQEVRTVCKLYHQAQELHSQGVHLVSTDEKTGIQALERINPTLPMEPNKPEAIEKD
jgi:hypothetical protein